MKTSDDRLDQTAINELQSLLARRYAVKITPARGFNGACVEVFHPDPRHVKTAEGRSHDLSRAMHRAYMTMQDRWDTTKRINDENKARKQGTLKVDRDEDLDI